MSSAARGSPHLGKKVERILSRDGRATGVLTADGEVPADVVVSNAGPDRMFSFLEEGRLPDDMMMMVLVVDCMDPSSVPDGKQLISAATPGPPICCSPGRCGRSSP